MPRFIANSADAAQLTMRLEEKVEKTDGCWLWTGAVNSSGYGVINVHGRIGPQVRAHRLAHYLDTGEAPEVVMHTCDTPRCVRPSHLRAGDHIANALDRDHKGRVAHGSRHYRAELSEESAADIRRRYAEGNETQAAIAADYGLHRVTISKVIRGVNWKRNQGEPHVYS